MPAPVGQSAVGIHRAAALRIRDLDSRYKPQPPEGWIRAIRELKDMPELVWFQDADAAPSGGPAGTTGAACDRGGGAGGPT